MNSEWSDEILISAANLQAYSLVYEAETWLRRVALTSLFLAEGPAWATKLDPSLRGRLQAQSRINSARWVLGQLAEVLAGQGHRQPGGVPDRHHRAGSCEPSQVHR